MSLVEKMDSLLASYKGSGLNPFQQKAISLIESRDDNFLVVGPTGIGKTIIGLAAILKHGRGFYLAPLRSLMREKYIEFREMLGNKYRIVLTNKDYSIPRRVLKEADIRVLSPYKFMIYADILEPSDGVVVVDEIHMVNKDPEMEATTSLIKTMGFKVIALSATVHRDDITRMSRWLNATAIVADEERPVPLKFSEVKLQLIPGGLVVEKGGNYFSVGEEFPTKYYAVAELVRRIYMRDSDGGILVWTPTRTEADTLASYIASRLPVVLPRAGTGIVKSSEHDKVLARSLEYGVGLHHGGVSSRNREVVEELFREKKVRIIVSCFTLSHGVNFPVRYLVVSSISNYDGRPLDPSTFHQIAGRAGRPGLDSFGEVIVVTVGDLESYILTKLVSEKASRIHSRLYNKWTLAKIAAQRLAFDGSIDGFTRFLRETYYAQEHGIQGIKELQKLAEEVVEEIVDAYFDISGERVVPRGRAERVAAVMGLHPKERAVYDIVVRGDYRSSVLRAAEAAREATGVEDRGVVDKVLDYGFLAIYAGGWKVREVAEYTQTVLDAIAVYTRRLHGWRSREFENARRIAELYSYGGNPRVECLAKVLRHDEMKRLIRNLPQVVFPTNLSPNDVVELVSAAIKLIFEFKKRIYLKRVYRVVDALLETMLGDKDLVKTYRELARRYAYDAVREITKTSGAVVTW